MVLKMNYFTDTISSHEYLVHPSSYSENAIYQPWNTSWRYIILLGNQRPESCHAELDDNNGTHIISQTSILPWTRLSVVVDGHDL